ncbi:MAG TPA: thermonuclease family protein [Polaromonas sp.]|uniref:thermonuclease family protein n=1 Tax=Polaromonas sp. TaxID=1869339 RepID=UPI002D344DCC|nr:thermonuclease family protein [Polaromonas sp.]HYW56900.1 thermonuclease family protein [Polaromonas sp.]
MKTSRSSPVRFWIAIALIAIFARTAWAGSAKVTYVTDGDTLWVRPGGAGKPIKIRIDGIDAPEICQAGGEAARAALASRVVGRTVVFSTRRQDDYGRHVATIELDGEDVAAWMVGQGHAWSYQIRRDGSPYRALQIEARSARRGLFAQPGAMHPRVFRRQHGSCRT